MRQFSPLLGGLCRILPDRNLPQVLGARAPWATGPFLPVRDTPVLAPKTAAQLPLVA
jgi:hypothetical protein